jgi:lysophospholipase L1-like esterase
MKLRIKFLSVIVILFTLIFVSCDDYNEIDPPVVDQVSGNADFSRYVALGNSITAGYQSGALYQSSQIYSFTNLIAKQVGTKFEMPLVSDPGAYPGRLEIQSLSPFTLYVNSSTGSLLNYNYSAPYNNLGVYGALTYDILFAKSSTTCASYVFTGKPNPYFDIVLRNNLINKGTPLEQALSQAPTFLTLCIGSNDVLGYATSGGTSPSAPTSVTQFTQLFGGIAQGIQQFKTQTGTNPGVVVANIPNVSAIPFFTTVGPALALNPAIKWWQIRLLQQSSGLPATGLIYGSHEGGTNLGFLPYKIGFADSAALLSGSTFITLSGQTYAPYLGQPTGKFYRDNNLPIPLGVDTTQLFGFHPQNPFPDVFVLDPNEITTSNNAVTGFNNVIATIAQQNNFGLVDINTRFNQFRAADFTGGTVVNGITFKTTYVTGGLFSLDGVHPSSQAQGIIANEFINVINTKYNAKIPLVDVSAIPGSFNLHKSVNLDKGNFVIPHNAFEHLLF